MSDPFSEPSSEPVDTIEPDRADSDHPAQWPSVAAAPTTGDTEIDAALLDLHDTAEAGLTEHLGAAERLQTLVASRLADLTGR